MRSALRKCLLTLGCVGTLAGAPAVAPAQDFSPGSTQRVSKGTFTGSTDGNAPSVNARVSKNGRFVVFESTATNLINYSFRGGGTITPGRRHIYLYDRQADSLEIVSLTHDEKEPSTDSFDPAVSQDGRYVAFTTSSEPTSMVTFGVHLQSAYPGHHVYVRDRMARDTFMIDQVTTPVLFQDRTKPRTCIDDGGGTFVPQLSSATILISSKNIVEQLGAQKPLAWTQADSRNPRFSGDGKYVVYDTSSDNLIFKDNPVLTKSEASDLKNPRVYPTVTPIPTPGPGTPTPTPTPIGTPNTVCEIPDYTFQASDPPYAYKWIDTSNPKDCVPDLCETKNYSSLYLPSDGHRNSGGYYFYEPQYLEYRVGKRSLDSNDVRDVYIRDGVEFANSRVSLSCKFHEPGHPECNVQGETDSENPSISDDGALITFSTTTPFLELDFNNVSDVYVVERDKVNDEVANLRRISNDTSKLLAANGASTNPAISGDGRYVAFQSEATNLVAGDTNGKTDVFVFDRKFNQTIRCNSATDEQGTGDSVVPDITGSGEFVSFSSSSSNFGTGSTTSNAYVGKISRSGNGRIESCTVTVASPGVSGTGLTSAATNVTVGMVPKTTTVSGKLVRVLQSSAVYQTDSATATLGSDTNGTSDIFQTPQCSVRDRTTDTDGDGTTDCFDQCYLDAQKVTDVDDDADGTANCEDGCAADSQKVAPGECGCGVADTDLDGDGVADCKDECPSDSKKAKPGECGCGQEDVDLNGDKVVDCKQTGAPTPGPTPTAVPSRTATPRPGVTPRPTATPAGVSAERAEVSAIRLRSKRLKTYRVTLKLTATTGEPTYSVTVENVATGKKVTRRTSSPVVDFDNMKPGLYTVTYKMKVGDKEYESPVRRFRIKG